MVQMLWRRAAPNYSLLFADELDHWEGLARVSKDSHRQRLHADVIEENRWTWGGIVHTQTSGTNIEKTRLFLLP
jgi:hypothetical protein